MSEQISIGVVGTGLIAGLVHLPSLKSHPGAKVAAICGRNRDRAGEMAKKYEVPLVFTDYREMIEKGNLDALVIAAPDDLHYVMTMEALDAGLHVMCEKALALNVEDARKMYEKAKAVGVKHMIFFTRRWLPHYRYLRELIDEGYVGIPFHCLMRFINGRGRGAEYGWIYDRQRSNGVLAGSGSHMIDQARWYVGEITKVNANLSTYVERPGADGSEMDPANDSAFVTLQFDNGAQGMIQLSDVAHVAEQSNPQQTSLHGELGTLELDISFALGGEIRGARHDEEQFRTLSIPDHILEGIDQSQPFMSQLLEVFTTQSVGDRMFIDAIIEDKPISPSFYDGLKVQEVIDAAIESHKSGSWVSVK